MKKRSIGAIVLVLLFSSLLIVAQEEIAEECGFWCKVGQFLWGSSEARAGKGWFDRGVVGE